MQLRTARLCLDCEEIHASSECPVCASESFVYLSRWVPADERRRTARPARSSAQRPAQPGGNRWVARGALGLTALAVGRWLWQTTRPVEWSEPGGSDSGPGSHPDNV